MDLGIECYESGDIGFGVCVVDDDLVDVGDDWILFGC